jgi:hypothetical protein
VISQQFEYAFADAFELNVKLGKLVTHSFMNEKRAKHCLCLYQDPHNIYNKFILAIGGVTITYKKDPYQKRTYQITTDLNTIECFSFETKKWDRFNAKLQIARHSASTCYLHDFIYVIGGHTVEQPNKFINTIERCHKLVPSSHFERLNIRQPEVDFNILGQLSVPIPENNGILILTASDPSLVKDRFKNCKRIIKRSGNDGEPVNHGYFVDLKAMELKKSKFDFSLGPITSWHNSYALYEQRFNFLTERLQVLRFENHSCEWSLFDIPEVDRVVPDEEVFFDEDDNREKKHPGDYLYTSEASQGGAYLYS